MSAMRKTSSDRPKSRGIQYNRDNGVQLNRRFERSQGSGGAFAARDTRVFSGGKTTCRFCRRVISYVDYKDVDTLVKLLTNRGKIYSRKRSGNCAGCQRKVKRAIKRARYMALLPFST